MKKRLGAIILSLCMVLSLVPVTALAAEPTYSDTKGHWAENSIERWSDYKIVQGNNGQFEPDGQLTCAQLATILSRLLKLPAAPNAGFTDSASDAWYFDAINRCAAAGILQGNGDGTVTPSAPISRERAIVMLGRALGIEPISSPDLTKYTDAAKVAPYAQGMLAAMIDAGIVSGVGNNQLAPKDEINRASTVTILDRAISTYADKAGETVQANGGLALVVADNVTLTGNTDKLLVPTDGIDVTLESSKSTDSIAITGDNSTVTVKNSSVDSAAVSGDNSKVILSNSSAGNVTLSGASSKIETSGNAKVENVAVTEDAKGATVTAGSGTTIKAVDNKAADATVTGSGTVSKVASDTGVTVETKNTDVENTGSNTITVTDKNGKDNSVSTGSDSSSTTTVNKDTTSGGGSSGGGSSSHSHSYTYTDNGDGTHTGKCSANDSTLAPEAHNHDGENGACSICGAKQTTASVASVSTDSGYAYYDTLPAAVKAAKSGQTVTLLSDVTAANIWLKDGITLDLGGHTVDANGSYGLYAANGVTATVKNGTIKNSACALVVWGAETSDNRTTVTVDKDFTITDCSFGVIFTGYASDYQFTGKTGFATLNFNGKIDIQKADQCPIFVMGNLGNDSDSASAIGENGNQININATANIYSAQEVAIVLNGMAKLNVVDGAVIEGADAITMKRGYLNITGGTLKGTGAKHTPTDAEHSGAESSGSAVTVASTYNYSGLIDVKISGGSFTSANSYGFYAGQSVDNGAAIEFTNTSFAISGGDFSGDNGAVYFATGKYITGGTYSTDPSAYVAAGYTAGENAGVWTIEHAHDGSEAYPYTLTEFNALTRENTQNKTTIVKLGTQDVTDISYSEHSTGYTGKGVMMGNTHLNYYNAPVPAVGTHKFVFKDGTVNGTVTGYSSIDGATTNSMYMLLPGNSDVTFENVDFTNVVSFDIQKYTAGWSHLNSITFKNCTFNGIIVGTCPASDVTFDGCTFNSYTNTASANNSNPIWWRAEGEGQGSNATYIKNFTFTNNKVTGTRPVKIERIGRDGCNPVFTFKNNQFDITLQGNEDGQAKNMAINIGQYDTQSKFTLIDDGNTISSNTAALYTAALSSGSNQYVAVPGCKVLDGSGNEKTITAMVWKSKTGETFEMKTIPETSES